MSVPASFTSIGRRLTLMSALSSSLALLVACTAFLLYDLVTFRDTLTRDLRSDAHMLAVNVTAPLLFDDPEAARASLDSLRAKPRIHAAVVTDEGVEGAFARYDRAKELDASGPPTWLPLSTEAVTLSVPVMSEGEEIGTVTLEAGMEERAERMLRYILLTAAILVVSLLAASGVAAWLQGRILKPIALLTRAAQRVTRRQDYSVRVPQQRPDELGLLSETFNTMLERIEQQSTELKRAVQMRDEFLSIASHELKTPLTPLQLQVQSLIRIAERDPSALTAERVRQMDRQVHRLARLVDDLLDISRVAVRKLDLHLEEMDLATLVREVVRQYRDEATRKGCHLSLEAPESLIGLGDPARIEQVLVNLLSNAIKYGPGEPIEVTLELRGGRAHLVIQDRGIGIAEEDLERIFDRYERAVSDRHYGGFGLGLWIVKELVTSMGGTVAVSGKPGEGARFEVELPIEERDGVEEHRDEPGAAPSFL